MEITSLVHYVSIALCAVVAALGVSIGQGRSTQATFSALYRQPALESELLRASLLSLALSETAVLFGLIFSLLLVFATPPNLPAALAELGIVLSISLPGITIGYFSYGPTKESLLSIARQPFISRRLANYMLLVLSSIQTPLIFGFIIASLIKFQLAYITTIGQGLALLGAGIALGVGSIGPVIGSCIFTQSSCKSVGRNSSAFPSLLTFTFYSQAIIETPIIFATIISYLLIQIAQKPINSPFIGLAYLLFGCTIGFGTLGTGISSGKIAAAAARQIAYAPKNYALFSRGSMIAQGIVDTIAIYALVVALTCIYSTP